MKVAKIVPCFPYTHYRNNTASNSPNSYSEWEQLMDACINAEQTVDPGVDMDLFLYYRYLPESELGKEFLFQYNGKRINRGTIHVYDMPNDHTMGFSSILEFLERDSSGYDYMIFQEDDICIEPGSDGYVLDSINMIKSGECNIVNYSVHVPALPRKPHGTQHVGGAFALYPINPLLQHLDGFPLYKQTTEVPICQWMFKILGNLVKPLQMYCTYPSNVDKVRMFHSNYSKINWHRGQKFLYRLGH